MHNNTLVVIAKRINKVKSVRARFTVIAIFIIAMLFVLEGCGYWAQLYDKKPSVTIKLDGNADGLNKDVASLEVTLKEYGYSYKVTARSLGKKTIIARKPSNYIFGVFSLNQETKIYIYNSKLSKIKLNDGEFQAVRSKIELTLNKDALKQP